MARKQTKVQSAASFTGGFITEASPLTFPENSALDINNMDINPDGSVSRRPGINMESGYTTKAFTGGDGYDYEVFSWRNAAGLSAYNFKVVKAGQYVYFYPEGSTLSTGIKAFSIDLDSYKVTAATTTNVRETKVDMSYGKGLLFIVGKYIEPLRVSYDPVGDSITVVEQSLQMRDFIGVDDGLGISERPATLSSEHLYNLLNQGWDTGKINTYFSATGLYPSNADIWSAGRDASNNFSPTEMNKINFGNSRAPRGRFITELFDTTQSFSTSNRVKISNIDFATNTITFAAPHGLSVSDTFDIDGSDGDCSDGSTFTPVDWDGTYTVATVVSTVQITVTSISDGCAHTLIVKDYGDAVLDLVSNPAGSTSDYRPEATAFYAGRAFYAGVEADYLSDTVFFSQILIDEDRAELCYQDADPTSDEISDIVDTDGGTITIVGLGKVTKMMPIKRSLMVFSENGIWEIAGGGEGYFTATDYAVRRVSKTPCLSPKAVVEAENLVFFFAEDGVYVIRENEITGLLEAQTLSDQTIKSHYLDYRDVCKRNAAAVYDYRNKRVIWLIRSEASGCAKKFDSALIFDLRLTCFYKYTFASSTNYVVGVADIRDVASDEIHIKYLVSTNDTAITFAALNDSLTFYDWTDQDSEAYVITGHATLGDIGVKKSARQLILHMTRTETGFEDDGSGNLVAIHPSSCKVRVAWDWTDDAASNKWTSEFQGYRYRQLYIPTGVSDTYETGYEVITTKTKLRGTGRAFSLRFRSEAGKDMKILGWSIAGDFEIHE